MTKSVLVVDDDPFDQALFLSAFERVGSEAQVEIVSDVNAALARLEQGPLPTLVLVDLKLRHESGLEVVRWLRQHSELRWIPVVTLSGSDDPRDIRASYDAGANAYLVKPQTLDDIDDVVSRIDAFWLGACALADDSMAHASVD